MVSATPAKPKRILLQKHVPGKPTQFLWVKHKRHGDKGFYRHALSLDYFRERELAKAFPNDRFDNVHNTVVYTNVSYPSDIMSETEADYYERTTGNIVPTVEDIFEGYLALGYDYKKQRYV